MMEAVVQSLVFIGIGFALMALGGCIAMIVWIAALLVYDAALDGEIRPKPVKYTDRSQ